MNEDNSFNDIQSDSDHDDHNKSLGASSGEERSIRRIPISGNRRIKPRRPINGGDIVSRGNGPDRPDYPERKNSKFGIWIVAIISIIVLFFVFSLLFSGVKIKVTPKQEAVLINGEFTAFKEAQSGELVFDVMTLSREVSKEVVATGEEFVEEKASGKIIIYNDYSTAGQKLIENTRFETPNGLIYRIEEAVTVPGQRTSGGETVPGSIEVTVYADEEGPKYNIGLSDFTIPGLKGDPRFSKFYARSKAPITGGVSGLVKKASDADLEKASKDLEKQLEAEILKEAMSVKPEGFVLLDNAFVVETTLRTENAEDGNVKVVKTGTFKGLIFNENDLAKFVAEQTIALYDGLPVEFSSTDNLRLTIDTLSTPDIATAESVDFELDGDAKIVWLFDSTSLVEDLKGMPKGDIDSVLANYPGIESAEVVVRPFWKRTIAENDKKIKLEKVVE